MTRTDSPAEGAARVRAALVEALPAALPGWLETRRWFADKGRGISGVEFEDVLVERVRDDWLALTIARIELSGGETARYFVPVAWTRTTSGVEPIAAAQIDAVGGAFIDATEAPWFGAWLIDTLTGPGSRADDRWLFTATPSQIEAARGVPATLMRAEQSNTSLRFGESLMAKIVRRLQPGPNPDEEMLRALADVGFERVPPYAGAASWRASSGGVYPIALAQVFVPNLGDGWSWMLDRLRAVATGEIDPALGRTSPEWLLGHRTGELHVALSYVEEPAFRNEPTDAEVIAANVQRTREAVRQAAALLGNTEDRLPDPLRQRLPAIVAGLQASADRAEGFRHEANTRRIRVHGDYHLGQTLRTPDGDWTIIDFEGEPLRPVAERRQKTSALKDAAGMLRSFAYVRGAVERSLGLSLASAARERLSAWEIATRAAFLDGYRAAIGEAAVVLAPEDDDAFRKALDAWEFDKALYEIAYEVRNRPDWIDLPLRSLLPDDTG